MNKVVVRFSDGRLVKGITADFFPNKTLFHVTEASGAKPIEINITELKALFLSKI